MHNSDIWKQIQRYNWFFSFPFFFFFLSFAFLFFGAAFSFLFFFVCTFLPFFFLFFGFFLTKTTSRTINQVYRDSNINIKKIQGLNYKCPNSKLKLYKNGMLSSRRFRFCKRISNPIHENFSPSCLYREERGWRESDSPMPRGNGGWRSRSRVEIDSRSMERLHVKTETNPSLPFSFLRWPPNRNQSNLI